MGLKLTERVRTHGHFRGLQERHGSGAELKIIVFCSFLSPSFSMLDKRQSYILPTLSEEGKQLIAVSAVRQCSPRCTYCPVPIPQTTWPRLEIQRYYFLKKRYKAMDSQKLCALTNAWHIPCSGSWHLKYVICGESSCFGRTHVRCQVISLWVVVQWDTFSGWNESKLWPEICCVWTFMCDLSAHTSSRAALRIGEGSL